MTALAPKRSAMASSARFSACAVVGGGANRPELRRGRGDQVLGGYAGQPGGARRLAREQRRCLPVQHLAVVGRSSNVARRVTSVKSARFNLSCTVRARRPARRSRRATRSACA